MSSAQAPLEATARGATITPATTIASRHSLIVRVTHWLTALCFFALLITGVEIFISHPRLYWGETGNVLTSAWLQVPIPSSRPAVQTGYGYTLPDQNGWSRALHFQSAWLLVFTGLLYFVGGIASGHFRKNLLPGSSDLSLRSLLSVLAQHMHFRRPSEAEAHSYNVLQRTTYLAVIFILFPLVIWTGLAMSPAFDAAFPPTVTLLGGRQSARTLHFLVSGALVLFFFVHVAMVWLAGFRNRTRAMITGRVGNR